MTISTSDFSLGIISSTSRFVSSSNFKRNVTILGSGFNLRSGDVKECEKLPGKLTLSGPVCHRKSGYVLFSLLIAIHNQCNRAPAPYEHTGPDVVGIFGDARQVFGSVRDEPITLCFSSPPYLLRNARAYGAGAESEAAYVEFIVRTLEPIVKNLVRGGSIVLNLTQDAFVPGRPSRSLYLERLILALADDLGLELMDRLVWVNRAKAPGPTQWACKKRVQLGVSYEPVIWLTSDAMHVRSDNRRVLVPHTEAHQKLIDAGGELRTTSYGDGAHRLKAGSFSAQTEGAIAKNTLIRGNLCPDTLFCHKVASELGLPRHGATSPTWLASFFIEFLTKPGELVVDHFSGYFKTAIAAERLGRRWIGTDKVLEWIAVASHMFRGHPGFEQTPLIDSLIDSYQK